MTKLLAIDPATTTGFAYTATGRVRDAKTGIWKVKGTEHKPHALAALQSASLTRFLEENDVYYALIEKPVSAALRSITTQNSLWCLGGGLSATMAHHGIPYRTVQPNEWRSAVFGVGAVRLSSGDAKRMAIETAKREGINAGAHDAVEAACP